MDSTSSEISEVEENSELENRLTYTYEERELLIKVSNLMRGIGRNPYSRCPTAYFMRSAQVLRNMLTNRHTIFHLRHDAEFAGNLRVHQLYGLDITVIIQLRYWWEKTKERRRQEAYINLALFYIARSTLKGP
jgi:hypothetical protein